MKKLCFFTASLMRTAALADTLYKCCHKWSTYSHTANMSNLLTVDRVHSLEGQQLVSWEIIFQMFLMLSKKANKNIE